MSNAISMERVEEIIYSYGCERCNVIAIMQDIQAEYKYLSQEVLERIAEKLNMGVAKVYSVATFYENFSLEAKVVAIVIIIVLVEVIFGFAGSRKTIVGTVATREVIILVLPVVATVHRFASPVLSHLYQFLSLFVP